MRMPEAVREQLKEPLGKLHIDFKEIKKLSATHRIIAIGDICTLSLLGMGIMPHLAVFDYRYMRKDLEKEFVGILNLYFKDPREYSNPAGTLSEDILNDAKMLIREGGGVLVKGEEDITALAFILNAGERDVIVYGQPNEGMVVVTENKKVKEKIEKWLASSVPL